MTSKWSKILVYILLLSRLIYANNVSYVPFVRRGIVYKVKEVVELEVAIDLSNIRKNCMFIKSHVSKFLASKHMSEISFAYLVNRTLIETDRFCQSPVFSLSQSSLVQHHVQKRQAVLVAAGLGMLASYVTTQLFSSSSHSGRIEQHNFHALDSEMMHLQEYVKSLTIGIENYKSQSHAQLRLLQFQTMMQSVMTQAKSASDGLVRLTQGELSTEIVSVEQAKQEVEKLGRLAHKLNAKLPFEDILSLYVFPVKHTLSRDSIEFSISIPLVSEKYENWRFLHAPIFVEHENEPVFLTPEPKNSYLAVPQTGESIVLSDNDFSHCTKWYNDYFCTFLPTRREDDFCLVSLFHEPSEAEKSCDFSLPAFPTYILTHLNENQFLLSLNRTSLSFEEICPKGKTSFGTFFRGQTLIQVKDGCSVSTKMFDIPVFSSIQQKVRVRPFSPSVSGILAKTKNATLAPAFSLLQHIRLQEIPVSTPLDQWPYHLGTLFFLVALFVIVIVVLRCVFAKRIVND